MKSAVFWDVTLCGSCKHRRVGGTYRLRHQGEDNQRAKNHISSNQQLTPSVKKVFLR
jgi:hypothetical protein